MFKKMKVSTKLILGFGIVLIMTLAIAVASYVGLSQSVDGFNSYRSLAIEANQAGRVQANILKAELDVKNFIDYGEQKYVSDYGKDKELMLSLIDETKGVINDKSRLDDFEEIESHFTDYDKAFNQVVELMNRRDEIVYNLINVQGVDLSSILDKLMQSAYGDGDTTEAYYIARLQEHLLKGRLYVTKFLDDNSEASIEVANEELYEKMNDAIDLLEENINEERRTYLADFESSLNEYKEGYNELIKVIQERNNLIENELDRIGPVIADGIEDIKLEVKGEQDKLGPKIKEQNDFIKLLVIIVAIVVFVVAIIVIIIITISITRTLGGEPYFMADIMNKVSKGILDIDSISDDGKEKKGLLGDVVKMVDSLKIKSEKISRIADGDLTVDINLSSKSDEIGLSLKRMVKSLNEIISEINNAVMQISDGADQLSNSSQELSGGASEQASSLEEITASISEISSQVQSNTENAQQSAKSANKTRKSAIEGNSQMKELVKAMEEINKSATDINNIVKVIDDIAFQTNLLALNADIEAARVGKYGKGFAVVANSVRNLASKSGQSVKETTALVEGAIKNIERGSVLVEKTSKQLDAIAKDSEEVSGLAEDVSDSSQEQSKGIEQISTALNQVEEVVQSNSASSEENASTSEELAAQSQKLKEMISHFSIKKKSMIGGYDIDNLTEEEQNAAKKYLNRSTADNNDKSKKDKESREVVPYQKDEEDYKEVDKE